MERPLMLAKKYEHLNHRGEQALEVESSPINNVTSLPAAKVKSGAIESLLSQNEDLSARIKILLRRLANIEEENLTLTHEHREMKNQMNGILDQASVYREKESSWRERTILAEETLEIQQSQLRQKEIEFAKLRAQEWEQRSHLQAQHEKIEKAFHRMLRFRARIKNWIQPAFKKLIQNLKEKEVRIERLQKELQKTEIHYQMILQQNMGQIQKQRHQMKQIEDEKIQIISQFELVRRDLEAEIHSLRDSSDEFRKKAAKLERSLERQDYLENRLIFAERENNELRERFTDELSSLQSQMYDWRQKAQNLEMAQTEFLKNQTDLQADFQRKKEIAERLEEQMETMRLLWQEKVKENEKLKAKCHQLDAINVELSQRLRNTTSESATGV